MGITFGRTKHKADRNASTSRSNHERPDSSSSCRLPRCLCGCDQLSRTDLDRYTDRLHNVLHCPRGRTVLRDFLRHKGLNDAGRALEFWEACHAQVNAPLPDLPHVLRLAEDVDDLDFTAIERLSRCAQEQERGGDEEEARRCLKEVQDATMDSLKNEYELFRRYLLEKKQNR